MEHLFEKLQKYTESDIYPYHMPGHKRKSFGMLPEELYKIDITEIDGFDNLHQPEDILRSLQQEAAALYGAEESFYLVNGSTSGILSAVSSALPGGGHILMARNCHKSAYHAVYLRGLSVTYLYPPYLEEYDIYDAIEPCRIQQALDREPDIGAVLIVSPTYEGRISDIRAIAEIVHGKGIPLIVDEAHGAHLGLGGGLPPNSCQMGADLVIHSVHKTLPAPTQTALLHVNGGRIDRERLRRFLRIYQSSSPSYLLMAGIDNALEHVKEDRSVLSRFRERYESMVRNLTDCCRHLRFLPMEDGRQDVGKLLVSVKQSGLTGRQLYDILLQKYHLQLEMASVSFVLAMFTVNDSEEGYWRMAQALLEIDASLGGERAENISCEFIPTNANHCCLHSIKSECIGNPELKAAIKYVHEYRTQGHGERCSGQDTENFEEGRRGQDNGIIPLAEAWDRETKMISLEESVGRPIGEFVNLYPPGVPLLVPGEPMTERLCREIRNALEQGLQVQGVQRKKRQGEAAEVISVPVIL